MKVLITLFVSFIISCGISKIATGDWQLIFGGNPAMFLMLGAVAPASFIFLHACANFFLKHYCRIQLA